MELAARVARARRVPASEHAPASDGLFAVYYDGDLYRLGLKKKKKNGSANLTIKRRGGKGNLLSN